jgi:hypothetical protein
MNYMNYIYIFFRYLSAKSEADHYNAERRREEWEGEFQLFDMII